LQNVGAKRRASVLLLFCRLLSAAVLPLFCRCSAVVLLLFCRCSAACYLLLFCCCSAAVLPLFCCCLARRPSMLSLTLGAQVHDVNVSESSRSRSRSPLSRSREFRPKPALLCPLIGAQPSRCHGHARVGLAALAPAILTDGPQKGLIEWASLQSLNMEYQHSQNLWWQALKAEASVASLHSCAM